MGGSGGFFGGGYESTDDLVKKVKDSEAAAVNQGYETEVNGMVSSLLTDINDRNTEAIQKHLTTIKKSIEKEIDGTIDLLFGGSVSKHTYVDGLSDVDSLVILNNSDLSDKSPEDVKDYFCDQLKKTLFKTEIENGALAVTIKFSDVDVQLLPAIRYKDGFRIADETGKGWLHISPNKFADKLSDANKNTSSKVIPTIKLAKSIISTFPEKRQLSGYHVEALAVEVFKSYTGPKIPKDMLKHFFQSASDLVRTPLHDKTGQSLHVDDYLGKKDSLERKMVADSLSRIGRKMQNADVAGQTQAWKEILDI